MQRLGLCALMVLAACGGSKSGDDVVDAPSAIDSGPPDATPTVTLDDVCGTDGAYEKLIAKLVACNPGIDLIAFQGQATAANVSALCHGAIDPYTSTIDLPSYAELQACLTYVQSTACLDLDFNSGPCGKMLHGKVADNSGCDSTEQCTDASWCDRPNGTTCGTCKPRKADGQACTADEQCTNGKCVGTQCGHPGLDGDPCVIMNNSSDDCLGQRSCNTTSHQCETKTWQLNDTCSGGGDCGILQTDLYCKIPQNQTTGQCAKFLAIGDQCGAGLGQCDLRAYDWCNQAAQTPRCTAAVVVQDGAACSILQGRKCDVGLVCSDPINGGKCYTPGVKDDACGGASDPPCGLFMGCVSNQCEYTDDTPACP